MIQIMQAGQMLQQAMALHQAGRLAEAEALYRNVLQFQPRDFDTLHMLGVLHAQRGQPAEAADFIRKALEADGKSPPAWNHLGNALQMLRKYDEALAAYDRAIKLDRNFAAAYSHRGSALQKLGRLDEALMNYGKAIALKPDLADAYSNRAMALQELKRPDEALENYARAIALAANSPDLFYNRGTLFQDLRRFSEALENYEKSLALNPNYVEAWMGRGVVLRRLKRYDDAIASANRAIALKPDFAEAFNNRAIVLSELKRHEEAAADFSRAISLKPDYAEAHGNRGITNVDLKRFEDALADLDRAMELKPDYVEGASPYIAVAATLCDWHSRARMREVLLRHYAAGRPLSPFSLLTMFDDPEMHYRAARIYASEKAPAMPPLALPSVARIPGKIRIAYVSADFKNHPVGMIIADLLERHDRNSFEVHAIALGGSDGSAARMRIEKAVDRFTDVSALNDEAAARLIASLGIDIAIDLNGWTQDCRPGIFAYRPAPVAVTYLGYAGSTGAPYFDYLIADPHIIAPGTEGLFSERIVMLPDTYMVTDPRRVPAAQAPSRAAAGLPENGFVFCCFNNSLKFSPDIFDIWMRLLRQVEGSVLWLNTGNATARANLGKEAEARGISAERIVFAPFIDDVGEHLARLGLADVFLDTFPYNAHVTACDALSAGVPVITCPGKSFASRVAAGLLHAVGMPQLIMNTLEEYEAFARRLAQEPEFLSGIRRELIEKRQTAPLFNAGKFRHHIETAYRTMWDAYLKGEVPKPFAVTPIG